MGADVSGLEALAAELKQAAARVPTEARGVVAKGALNVKTDWRANAVASGGPYTPHYPRTITYDLDAGPTGAEAVIGPDKGLMQGALGNLLEFGSVNNPPHNDGGRALLAEEPRFVAAVEAAAEELLP